MNPMQTLASSRAARSRSNQTSSSSSTAHGHHHDHQDRTPRSSGTFVHPAQNPSRPSFNLPSREGYIYKEGHKFKTWRRRWFVLSERRLTYYSSSNDTRSALGEIVLDANWRVGRWHASTSSAFGAAATMRGIQLTNSLSGKILRLRADDEQQEKDLEDWFRDFETIVTALAFTTHGEGGGVATDDESVVVAPITSFSEKASTTSKDSYNQLVDEPSTSDDEEESNEIGSSELYCSIESELKSINLHDQRFDMAITLSLYWTNTKVFKGPKFNSTTTTGHLLRFLHKSYLAISTKGNHDSAWECDPYTDRFKRLYDPKQGEYWWMYCYNMGDDDEYKGVTYIDLFLFLRTSALVVLREELGVPPEKMIDEIRNFLLVFVSASPTMLNMYEYTTNFSKVVHQLAALSCDFEDVDELNRRVMAGEAKFEPDLFENTFDQRETDWPQLCYYPNVQVMQLVWEDSSTGERIEATLQEQMELHDYPLDRQLLAIKPKKAWADVTTVPMKGVLDSKKQFFKYQVAPDLMSYSQWRYFAGVSIEQRDSEGKRKVMYAIRIERLLMPFIGSVIVPLFLIVMLSVLTMLVDPEELPDRASLVLTLLLTAVALYFVVKQGLPQVPYLTKMELYVCTSIVLLSIVAVESGVVHFLPAEQANHVDTLAMIVLSVLWGIPHLVLFFCESYGLFRRPWKSVYQSQHEDTPPELATSHHDQDLQVVM